MISSRWAQADSGSTQIYIELMPSAAGSPHDIPRPLPFHARGTQNSIHYEYGYDHFGLVGSSPSALVRGTRDAARRRGDETWPAWTPGLAAAAPPRPGPTSPKDEAHQAGVGAQSSRSRPRNAASCSCGAAASSAGTSASKTPGTR
jgi:hypothetical protein